MTNQYSPANTPNERERDRKPGEPLPGQDRDREREPLNTDTDRGDESNESDEHLPDRDRGESPTRNV